MLSQRRLRPGGRREGDERQRTKDKDQAHRA
jgi:hypothetical protein